MARYVKDIQFHGDGQSSFNAAAQFLTSNGFEYIVSEGENVFQKGKGIFINPVNIKLTFQGNVVRIEEWMENTILFGLSIGEIAKTGKVAGIGNLKQFIDELSLVIQQAPFYQPNNIQTQNSPFQSFNQPMQQPSGLGATCLCCGSLLQPGSQFCGSCGNQQPNIQSVQNITFKEFVDSYALPERRKTLKNISIYFYICAAVNFLVMLISIYPFWGLIDGVVLAGLAFLTQKTRNKIYAILLVVFSIVDAIATMALEMTPAFWWIVLSIYLVRTLTSAKKEFEQFKSNCGVNSIK